MATPVVEVAQVGALLRTRTKDAQGNELGTFTTATRPTADEVVLLIGQALEDVTDGAPADTLPGVPDTCVTRVQRAAALRAAMLVELTYYPEQISAGRSPYEEFKALYAEALDSVRECFLANGGAGSGGTTADETPFVANPLLLVDPAVLVGWRTQW